MSGPQQRVVGRWGALSIVAGSMLGIGIFITPPVVAAYLPNLWWFLAIWLAGGLCALAGAVAFSELGAAMPDVGGDYVYQRRALGDSWAFASGWTLFLAVFAGSIAALAVPLCQYQLPAVSALLSVDVDWSAAFMGPLTLSHLAALIAIVAITALNSLGARPAVFVHQLLTFVPLALLVVLCIGAIAFHEAAPAPASVATPIGVRELGLAYLPVYFAYSGWNATAYVAGEVDDPGRALPFGLVGGTLLITGLYLLMCWAYVRVLGIDGLQSAGEAGTALAAELAWGPLPAIVLCLIVAVLVGSLTACILTGARLAAAMAEGGALHPWLAWWSPRTGAPTRALWIQAGVACLFVVTGTFEQIIQLASLAMLLTGSLTVVALFVLRRREPGLTRPYLATGYPWLPGIYLVANAGVLCVMLSQIVDAESTAELLPVLGMAIMLTAYAIHRIARVAPDRSRHQG